MVDSNKVSHLESLVTTQVYHLMKGKVPTEIEIMNIASMVRGLVNANDEEYTQALKNIHSKMAITIDEGILIKDDQEFVEWYPERRAEIEFKFWNRYKEYLLIEKGWSTKVVNNIDKVSNDIVGLLGDPQSHSTWKRRGLVIGDVQSGKTSNFTAICNKATDVGYNVIIILTGVVENLRKQTQERQDTDLVGYDSIRLLNDKGVNNKKVGVGNFNKEIRLMTFTSAKNDFKSTILESVGLSLKSCNDTALFVVKKNKRILENLEAWLKDYNADENGIIDASVLIIDDEADNASVNTKEDEKPTAINRCIRNLLKCFKRESYVAVTATPYANIFINDYTDEEVEDNYGQDLFPKDFIYCLTSPSNYIGAKELFNDNGKYERSLEKIRDAEQVIPIKHKSDFNIIDIPDSLREAVYHFILVNAIRDKRGDVHTHRSMLINVSRFTNVQNQLCDYLNEWMEEIRRNTNGFSCLTHDESLKNKYINDLHKVWEYFEFEKVTGFNWNEIRTKYLAKAMFNIKVQSVNQSTGATSLDYSLYKKEGLRVIAVGGNSLSRGLTLEGLCTTYFYRNSQTYDTLMQMGRWFGYRTNYDDLFKVWMTPIAIDWYRTICVATEELKREIKRMNNRNFTPKDFGLKVRENPTSLIVTARNKMRHTEIIERDIDISGRVLETVNIDRNSNILKNNYDVVIETLENINTCEFEQKKENRTIVVKNIAKEIVIDLISKFKTPDACINNLAYNKMAIINYIDSVDHLDKWDLIIPSGSIDNIIKFNIGRINSGIQKQKRTLNYSDKKFISILKKNGRIITGESLKLGLTEEEKEAVENKIREEYDEKVTGSDYLFEGRNPLLFIHFIEDDSKLSQDNDVNLPNNTLVALSLAFPKVDKIKKTIKKARYRLNTVAIRQLYDFGEDDE